MFYLRKSYLPAFCALVLTGCGGTDPSKEVGNHMSITIGANSETNAGSFASISATATSSPAAIKSMNWSIQKTSSSPDLTLLNADCKVSAINSNGSAVSPTSTWTCAVNILTPPSVTTSADYKLIVTSIDAKGNASNSMTTLTVKPSTNPAPAALVSGKSSIVSGDYALLSCQGSGGSPLAKDKYSYQWVIIDNAGINDLAISTLNVSSMAQIVAPSVSATKTVTVACRVTDDALKTGVATQAITITPPLAAKIIPTVKDSLSFNAGTAVKLDASQTRWVDASGATISGKDIYFLWTQKSGTPVMLLNPTTSTPSVQFPTNNATSPDGKEAYVFNVQISDQPVVDGVSAGKILSLDAIYYVNTLSPISLTVGPITPVKSGTLGNITINAVGQSGYSLFYGWTQISGPAVTIGGVNRNEMSFLAPINTGTLAVPIVFRVAVSYAPLTAGNPGMYFTDVLVAVIP